MTARERAAQDKGFIQGLGLGLGVALIGGDIIDQPTLAEDLLRQSGLRLEDFSGALCDSIDMVVITKLYKEIKRKDEARIQSLSHQRAVLSGRVSLRKSRKVSRGKTRHS